MFGDLFEGPRGTVRRMKLGLMLKFDDITYLIVSNDFFEFSIRHINQKLGLLMIGSVVINNLVGNFSSVLAKAFGG